MYAYICILLPNVNPIMHDYNRYALKISTVSLKQNPQVVVTLPMTIVTILNVSTVEEKFLFISYNIIQRRWYVFTVTPCKYNNFNSCSAEGAPASLCFVLPKACGCWSLSLYTAPHLPQPNSSSPCTQQAPAAAVLGGFLAATCPLPPQAII